MDNSGPSVETRQPLLEAGVATTPSGKHPLDPADGWNCGGGVFDIKRWYVGIITPDFGSDEARIRCGSLKRIDAAVAPTPTSQENKLRTMRTKDQELNAPKSKGVQKNMAERFFGPMDAGSIRSASSALAASALGAGALALPYSFSLVGVGLGLVTLTFVAFVSALSLQILMVAARYTDTQSYAAILELSVGHKAAATILDLIVLMNGIGAIICILIFEGDFVPPALAAGLGLSIGRSTAILGAMVLVWPLTLSPNISALRFVTPLVPLVLLITICIVACDTPHFAHETREAGIKIEWWNFEPKKWFQAVAIMVNAFANHSNAVPVANQLDNPSIARIVKSTVNGNMLVLGLLYGLGLAGYLSWGSATKGDFLLNYPQDRVDILLCRVMLSIIVYFVLPVTILPAAKSGAQILQSLRGRSEEDVPAFIHACSATCLLLCCTFVALNVADVASVIGVLGGLFAASLMFWFPLCVYRFLLWPTQPGIFRKPVFFCLVLLGSLSWTSVAVKYLF